MDGLDNEIVGMLKKNSRMPFVDVAKKLGISEGTVRARVKKLTASKELRFTIEGNGEVRAIILLSTATGAPTTKVANAIKALGVRTVYEVSGQFDLVCLIEAPEISTINDTIEDIRRINDVADTNSLIVLKNS